MASFDHNGYQYGTYRCPPQQYISSTLADLDLAINEFWDIVQKNSPVFATMIPAQATVPAQPAYIMWRDLDSLAEAIIRVDQRKLHYRMYYNGMRWNELKQTATYVYWIIRYKPLYLYEHPWAAKLIDGQLPFPKNKINEEFCYFLILLALSQCGRKLHPDAEDMLRYDLYHRSVTYDSLATLLTAVS